MVRRPSNSVPKERLSRSEWELMRICWRLGRCTVREIHQEDRHKPRRDYRTILTFMTRMAKKGWLTVEKEGNSNRYIPAEPEKRAVRREIRRFLDEVIGRGPENLELLENSLKRRRGAERGSPYKLEAEMTEPGSGDYNAGDICVDFD